jgi:hypothetical protein
MNDKYTFVFHLIKYLKMIFMVNNLELQYRVLSGDLSVIDKQTISVAPHEPEIHQP